MAAGLRIMDPASAGLLWNHVADADAFMAQAAREGLAGSHAVRSHIDLTKRSPAQRLRRCRSAESRPRGAVRHCRNSCDPDTNVRFAAIQWVGEERLGEFRACLPTLFPRVRRPGDCSADIWLCSND